MSGVRKSASLSVVTLSWPIFIEIFLQMLIGNIDQFMMSHYSQEAVAAVANANQIMNIFIFLITVMSTATTILIAQYLGAKNPTKINEVTTVSIAFNFVFSSVAALFILVAHRMLFEWLGVPEEIIDDTSRQYSDYGDLYGLCGHFPRFFVADYHHVCSLRYERGTHFQ